jgi:hypothetical protein
MKALTPKGTGWVRKAVPPNYQIPGIGWENLKTGALVISSIDASGVDDGFEYHLSISKYIGKSSDDEAMDVLRQFGMDIATEDNAGVSSEVRHFWQPVKRVRKEKV